MIINKGVSMGDGRKKAEEMEVIRETIRDAILNNSGAKRVALARKHLQDIKNTERFLMKEHEELTKLIEKCDEFIYELVTEDVPAGSNTYELRKVMDELDLRELVNQ